jgi:2-keto-4-pentenoate hydratase/2-oxohepta-3-ene-1,7-dioic acid hydratase in catechol pathway
MVPMTARYVRITPPSGGAWALADGERAVVLDGAPWNGGAPTEEAFPLSTARLECPVAPRTIFGIGKNYRAHASEMGGPVPTEPLVFAKTTSSLLAPNGTVVLPRVSKRVDYEGELGVVIGKRARHVPVDRALDYVFGYTALCDVTARDLQKSDGQWTRAKGFDTFCPTGPAVVTGIDPSSLALRLSVNGATRQDGNTKDMVFDVATLVAHLSTFATLEPGDLIATGTPEGVGPLSPGDAVEVEIERIGVLTFRVAAED